MSDYDHLEERERDYQRRVVKLFVEQLRYTYLGDLHYEPRSSVNGAGQTNGPLREGDLRSFLAERGHGDCAIEAAVGTLREATRLSEPTYKCLAATNNAVYELLRNGVAARPAPEENETDVMFFDFAEPANNHFALAEEVSYIDPATGYNSRPDLVVYVNGIALCVIELKRSLVSLAEGIKQQLSNERDLIPSFFTTTQLTVVARHAGHREPSCPGRVEDDMHGFRYATLGTPLEFWCPWKEDSNRTGVVLGDEESFAQFFAPSALLFLVRYGVVSDGGVKKVMRPHQYHALRAAAPRLRARQSGVIWHSQGSGKSLTMVWLAAYIKDSFPDPRVVVLTDRTELDLQLSSALSRAGNTLHRATSQEDLLRTLQGGEAWLITTLIHKYGNRSAASEPEGGKIPLKGYLDGLKATVERQFPGGFRVKGKNIFVFVDECHRTQGGRLHEAMRAIMGPDVTLVGFTGTPLLRKDKNDGHEGYADFCNMSEKKFGPFIHKYLHKQAVEDHVVLDLQYEAREVEQRIAEKEQLDSKLDEITSGLSDERRELIRQRWGTLKKVYSSKERIERIGYSILDDVAHSGVLRHDWSNAMLVAGSVYSACRYYDFFQNRSSDEGLRGRVAVVTSYEPGPDDLRKDVTDTQKESQDKYKHDIVQQAYRDARLPGCGSERYEEWAKRLFVRQPGVLKLLIVVDKLLTGFDAPSATHLYIDKEMRDHTLFQAICRVNRLGTNVEDERGNPVASHKEYGLIVDFKHLFGPIEQAVTRFNDERGGLGGFSADDVEGLLADNIAKCRQRLEASREAYEALKGLWASKGLLDNDRLAAYYVTDDSDGPAEARRDIMYGITRRLATSYDQLADFMGRAGYTPAEAADRARLAREAAHIHAYVEQRSGDLFDPHHYDPDMRALLDRFLRAGDAEVIVPATADFSFLDQIEASTPPEELMDRATLAAGGDEKAAAEVIEAKARMVINNSRDRNPEAYMQLSERLQLLLDGLREQAASFAERMRQLIELLKAAKSGGSSYPPGIDTQRQKVYWDNRRACGFSPNDEEAARQARLADSLVENKARPDFRKPGSAHHALFKREIKKAFPDASEEQRLWIYNLAARNT